MPEQQWQPHDCFEVPLLGWSVLAVRTIVEGLETGAWSSWQEALENGGPSEGAEASSGQALGDFSLVGWYISAGIAVFEGLGSVLRFLLLLCVLFGTARGAPTEERGLSVWSPDSVGFNGGDYQVCPLTEDVATFQRTTEGAAQAFCMCVLITIGVWEIWKSVRRRFWSTRGHCRTVGCQTDDRGVVPLPLPEGSLTEGASFSAFGKEVSL